METRPPIRLGEHIRAAQVVELNVADATQALSATLSHRTKVRALGPVAALEGVRWLMPPSTFCTRFLVRASGAWTAILSNGTVPELSVPLSFACGGKPVHTFIWRPEHRLVAIDVAGGRGAAVQVMKDPRWQYVCQGELPWDVVRAARNARRAPERLTAEHVVACLRDLTGLEARDLWTTGEVWRIEAASSPDIAAAPPWPSIDDL